MLVEKRLGQLPQPPEKNGEMTLEAPEYLAPGQNFYNQEPFREVLRDVSGETGTLQEKLQWFVTSVSKRINFNGVELAEKIEPKEQALFPQLKNILGSSKRRIPRNDRETYFGALQEIFTRLSVYPDWVEYVKTQLSNNDYKYDGTQEPSVPHAHFVAPKSYAAWVSEKNSMEGRKLLLGIGNIFPQDIEGKPWSPAGGKVPGNRKWRIFVGSELAREQ